MVTSLRLGFIKEGLIVFRMYPGGAKLGRAKVPDRWTRSPMSLGGILRAVGGGAKLAALKGVLRKWWGTSRTPT